MGRINAHFQRRILIKKGVAAALFILMAPLGFSFANREYSKEEPTEYSSGWFRKQGDYLVYLTLTMASPRSFALFVFSDWSFFETGIGKRLRLSSSGDNFHWGIEFGLFTSLSRYGLWNFKNICVDGQYGVFGLFHHQPAIFLLRLNHYCSNLLQGAPEFSRPIRYSQYSVYGHVFYPLKNIGLIPNLKMIKPYIGTGLYLRPYPESEHVPFDMGIEVESREFLLRQKAFHFGFHCSFTGMEVLAPTCSLFFGWGTSSEINLSSGPLSVGFFIRGERTGEDSITSENAPLSE